MNWSALDFDWNHTRAFLVTAMEGSLSAAARELKQTQPTLSRQVAALEAELGVTLFERVGKRLVLTETGHDLLEHVVKMREAAELVALRASGRSELLVGEVRISGGEIVAAYLLPPILQRVRAEYPEITVRVVAQNQLSDLLRREADIAIRHVRPEQADLIAVKVRDSTAHLYAANSWIQCHGRPKVAADLKDADFVGAGDNDRFVQILANLGLPIAVTNFKWTSENHVVVWEMVRRGLGVGAMLREIAESFPAVERVLPQLPPIDVPYWLCTHRELRTSRRVRVVFDLLAEALRTAECAK